MQGPRIHAQLIAHYLREPPRPDPLQWQFIIKPSIKKATFRSFQGYPPLSATSAQLSSLIVDPQQLAASKSG